MDDLVWIVPGEAPWDAQQVPRSRHSDLTGWRIVSEDEAREHQAAVDAYRGYVGEHPLSAR